MQIRHKRATVVPDAGDASLVQPSDWNDTHECDANIITDNVTFEVGPGKPHASLNVLFDYINDCMASPLAAITINVDAGTHLCYAPITCTVNHALMSINGVRVNGLVVLSSTQTGQAPARFITYVFDATLPASVAVGGVLVFHNGRVQDASITGHLGAHVITGVTSNTVTVLNKNTGVIADIVVSKPNSVDVLCTVIRAADSMAALLTLHGSVCGTYDAPFLKHMAFDGAGLTSFGLRSRYNSAMNVGGTVAVINSGINLLAEDCSRITCATNSITSSSGSVGVAASHASLIDAGNGGIITACGVGIATSVMSSGVAKLTYLVDNAIGADAAEMSRSIVNTVTNRSYTLASQVDATSQISS